MNALNKYRNMRNMKMRLKAKPLRTMRDKRELDDIRFRGIGLIAFVFLVGVFGYDYLTHTDKPGLKMTKELRK